MHFISFQGFKKKKAYIATQGITSTDLQKIKQDMSALFSLMFCELLLDSLIQA